MTTVIIGPWRIHDWLPEHVKCHVNAKLQIWPCTCWYKLNTCTNFWINR